MKFSLAVVVCFTLGFLAAGFATLKPQAVPIDQPDAGAFDCPVAPCAGVLVCDPDAPCDCVCQLGN